MKKLRLLFAAAALLLTAACASLEAETPAQRVYAAQTDYNTLLAAVSIYTKRPTCLPTQTVLDGCRSEKVTAEIFKADDAAYTALRTAQTVVRTTPQDTTAVNRAIGAAVAAVGGLRTIITNYRLGVT